MPKLPNEFPEDERPTTVRELKPATRLADLARNWKGSTPKRQQAIETFAARMFAASERERLPGKARRST